MLLPLPLSPTSAMISRGDLEVDVVDGVQHLSLPKPAKTEVPGQADHLEQRSRWGPGVARSRHLQRGSPPFAMWRPRRLRCRRVSVQNGRRGSSSPTRDLCTKSIGPPNRPVRRAVASTKAHAGTASAQRGRNLHPEEAGKDTSGGKPAMPVSAIFSPRIEGKASSSAWA